jgi:hypothetical protein
MRIKSAVPVLLVFVLLLLPTAARASFIYTFDQTATTNNFSFTVPVILTALSDPLTPAIGQLVGGFTITDAVFGPFTASEFCVGFAGSITDAFTCGLSGGGNPVIGSIGLIPNPTAVGVYSFSPLSFGGFPALNRLTISEVSAVPEPSTLILLGTAVAGLRWRLRRRKRFNR